MNDTEESSRLRGIAHAVTIVSILGLLAKVLGFGEKVALAYFGGTTADVDHYFAAYSISFSLFVLIDDVVVPCFLGIYISLRERLGRQVAWAFFRRVTKGAAMFLSVVAAVGIVSPELLISIITPGFDAEATVQTARLLRWTLVGGLFLGIGALEMIVLNAHRSFAWPAFGGVVYKAGILLGIAFLFPVLGIAGVAQTVFIAAMIQVVFLWLIIRKKVRPVIDNDSSVRIPRDEWRSLARLMTPLLLGFLAASTGGFVDIAMGSHLEEGTIASLGYARRLVDLPILVLAQALGIVAFPRFAQFAARGEVHKLMRSFARFVTFSIVSFIPVSIVFMMTSETLVSLAFERGNFSSSSVANTGWLLELYAFGLCGFALEILVMRVYYASLNTWTPILVGLAFLVLNVAATLILTPIWGAVVIPVALVAQKWLKSLTLLMMLVRRVNPELVREFSLGLLRILPCGGVFGITFAILNPSQAEPGGAGLTELLELVLAGASAGIAYLCSLHCFRVFDFRKIIREIRESSSRLARRVS